MSSLASLLPGCRRAASPSGFVAVAVAVAALPLLLLPASTAQAQRLLTLVPGVSQAASAGDPGSMGPAPVAVQVDLDLLRSDPWRLEAPTPDGSVLVAERSVFEDRGGGDVMWSGGQPGAGYDTVVLTVEGGRLVGRFGAAGGGAYGIHAERDGRGGMASIFGSPEAGWCGADSNAEDAHEGHAHGSARAWAGAAAPAPPAPVSDPQSHDRLDILVAYTETAAKNWADRGGPEAAIRHAGDYMKMVFRNNGFEIEPRIVHIARASAALDRAGRDLGRIQGRPLHSWAVIEDGEMLRLRHEHRADLVHLFTGEAPHLLKACGRHPVLQKVSGTAADFFDSAYGWTSNHGLCGDYAAIFVHEVGHGLGANHEPLYAGIRPEWRIRPYAAGHVNYDIVPAIGTAMAYGGQVEPFFSTTRFGLYGAALGVAGERDNERTLRETLDIAVRYSDYLPSLEGLPAPPSDLRVRYEGGAAHLSWRDNAPDADGYELEYRYNTACCDSGVVRLRGRTEASIPLEHTSPGSWYSFQLRARKGKARSLRSGIVELFVPGEPPAAPSDFSVTVRSNGRDLDFHWTDNSDNEAGFDLWILLNGEPVERYLLPPDSEHAERSYFAVVVGGGVAGRLLPELGVDYGARVFAFDSSGQASGSEELTFPWEYPPFLRGPVADFSAFPIAPTTVRVTWTVDPEVSEYTVGYESQSTLDNFARRWAPGRGDAVTTGAVTTGWVDIEGLARGARYTFKVSAHGSSLKTFAYLTLGGRGPGPRAPSAFSVDRTDSDSPSLLRWRDNSADELGFVIQSSAPGNERWRRRAIAPADAESTDFPGGAARYRIFAYNERGYSLNSRLYVPRPGAAGNCLADEETLCLWNSRFEVEAGWREEDRARSGPARVVDEGTEESGLFYFFDPDNWEMLVKVLDGCDENGRVWVLTASTTTLGYWIYVYDTATAEGWYDRKDPGEPATAIIDTEAFSMACDGGAGGR